MVGDPVSKLLNHHAPTDVRCVNASQSERLILLSVAMTQSVEDLTRWDKFLEENKVPSGGPDDKWDASLPLNIPPWLQHIKPLPAVEIPQHDYSKVEALKIAVADGDIESVPNILSEWETAPIKTRLPWSHFSTALYLAIDIGNTDMTRCLTEHGVDHGAFAFEKAMTKRLYPVMQIFLDRGFDINEPKGRKDPGPLARSIDDAELVKWLLDRGADPNRETAEEQTPLSFAVRYGAFDIINLMLEAGGPGSTSHGYLIHSAIYRQLPDRLEILRFLLDRVPRKALTELEYEGESNDKKFLSEMQNLFIGCCNPLHAAASQGYLDAVRILLEYGADPMIADGKGRLASDLARGENHIEVAHFLDSQCARATSKL